MRSTHLFGDELTNTSGLAMLKQKSLFDAEYVHFTGFRSWKKGTVFPKWNRLEVLTVRLLWQSTVLFESSYCTKFYLFTT